MLRTRCLALMSLLAVLAGCGGGGRMLVFREPAWDYSAYERVAVVPVKCADERAQRAADVVTSELTNHLVSARMGDQRTFRVLTRGELADLMREQDLSNVDFTDPGTRIPENMIQVAQAIVVGSLTDCTLDARRENRTEPVYKYTRHGPQIVGQRNYWVHEHFARIGGDVKVIDVATGEVLCSYVATPVERDATSRDHPPSESPEDLACDAARNVALDFATHVAPAWVEVKVDKDCFVIARGYYDGQYDEVKELAADTPEITLVVRALPPACAKNTFRITIADDQRRSTLFDETLVWDPNVSTRGVEHQIPTRPLIDSGAEELVAKFYGPASDEPVMERKFKIVRPEIRQ